MSTVWVREGHHIDPDSSSNSCNYTHYTTLIVYSEVHPIHMHSGNLGTWTCVLDLTGLDSMPSAITFYTHDTRLTSNTMLTLSENSDDTRRLASGSWFRWKSSASINRVKLGDISLDLSKGCTKCQGSKVYLVVPSKFYESVSQT